MPGKRKALGDLFRPVGPKLIQSGLAWSSGGSQQITQSIDLSLPIKGIRLVFSGRLVIGTADMASVNPEGLLNLISNIQIQGTNARQKGNVTLWNIDLATAWVMAHLFGHVKNYYSLSVGGGAETLVGDPGTPFPTGTVASGAYLAVTQATYDWRIVCDFPFHPFESDSNHGSAVSTIPGFLVRNEEWKDSMQIRLQFGTVPASGAGSNALGVGAGGTTFTFTARGSASGTPTIDLYSLPMQMGADLKDSFIPGVLSRVASPVTSAVQTAGTNAVLLNLQKQPTPRIFAKIGVSTVTPAYSSLSDTNITALGVLLGGNRNVRNVLDIFAHKADTCDYYDVNPIQGYNLMDFMQSGNPDSSYPGQDIGDGATFQLVMNDVGVTNALATVVQEQMLHIPTGPLYSF